MDLNCEDLVENDSTVKPHLEMSQWAIYDHPRDYPGLFVMRRWTIRGGVVLATDEVEMAATLEEIRGKVPPGLYRMPRFEDDDPCIVEVWL